RDCEYHSQKWVVGRCESPSTKPSLLRASQLSIFAAELRPPGRRTHPTAGPTCLAPSRRPWCATRKETALAHHSARTAARPRPQALPQGSQDPPSVEYGAVPAHRLLVRKPAANDPGPSPQASPAS